MDDFKQKVSLNTQSGLSLVETVLAIGIMGSLAVPTLNYFSARFTQAKEIRKNSDLESIDLFVRGFLDCKKTLPEMRDNCKKKEPIDTLQANGQSLTTKTGSKIGKYILFALKLKDEIFF